MHATLLRLAAVLTTATATAAAATPVDVAALRARGPAGLDALLASYDAAPPAARPALAADIDAVAAQRYATVSRLYWYTDLDQAERAAHALHRPILALRLLGDLRDDLSCANSRLFRATLYANAELSAYLRAHYVLYWSSERPVPKVTIDFGDGRRIVRTTTGNSIHYVLDEDGRVLDALPGLYAARVFQAALTRAAALATEIRGQPAARDRAIAAYHARALANLDHLWQVARGAHFERGDRVLQDAQRLRSQLLWAQRSTMSKARVELPDLRQIGLVGPSALASDDSAAWAAIGQRAWNLFPPAPAQPAAITTPIEPPPPVVLDPASRALVAQLHNAGPDDQRATPAQLTELVAELEQHIVADTAFNEFTLRRPIHDQLAHRPAQPLAELDAWIYEAVFHTPARDRWLGLRPRDAFTGLPGDGVVEP